MSINDSFCGHVGEISPYVPGKPITALAREFGLRAKDIVKLASNENPLGMSPLAAAAAMCVLQDGAERYPDQFELVDKLAARHDVGQDQIVLGNGSNDVLDLVARVFLTPGRNAVCSQYAFAVYPIATKSAGAQCIVAAARCYGHDLNAMLEAITPATRLVWIANPNNPTGNLLPAGEVREFIGRVPGNVAIVLDEAYNEYLDSSEVVDSTAWINDHPNLVVTRTFSKIYGLAGLRVGYAIASPAVAGMMNRVRQPFNVSSVALAAASAALDDIDFVVRSQALNREGMAQLVSAFDRLGVAHLPSSGNFIALEVPQPFDTAGVNLALLQQGVIVRPIAGYGMPRHLRVTIGRHDENARFLHALTNALTPDKAKGARTPSSP